MKNENLLSFLCINVLDTGIYFLYEISSQSGSL